MTRRLAALVVGCALVVASEAILGLVGVTPLSSEDRFVGFGESAPLFVPATEDGQYVLARERWRFFSQQSFRQPKPPGTFRIISFGGSTTFGHPYGNETSFPTWTARLLQEFEPGHAYESINAGGISYASYRVRKLMTELARFSPDLFVLYSGHNEFLERRTYAHLHAESPARRRLRTLLHHSRIYTLLYRLLTRYSRRLVAAPRTVLPGEVVTTLEEAGPASYHRDDAFRDNVIAQYRYEIESMVSLARERRIPLVICTLTSNLSGFAPFKSEHRLGMSSEELAAWNLAVTSADLALKEGDFPRALKQFAVAEAIDDRFALLHYRKGEALLALGRATEAYAAFNRAKEEDVIPLRALDAFNAILREVAARENVALADVEALFRTLAPDGIPGGSLFADHIHPTLEAQQRIALLIVETAVSEGLVPLTQPAWSSARARAPAFLQSALARVRPEYLALGNWVVGGTYLWAGRFEDALPQLQKAWEQIKNFSGIPLGLGKIEIHRGNWEAARDYLRAARGLAPGDPEVAEAYVVAVLGLGRAQEALEEMDRPGPLVQAPAYHVLRARALAQLGRDAEARTELHLAERDAERTPGLNEAIGSVLWRLGEREEARRAIRRFLAYTAHPAPEEELGRWEAMIQAGGDSLGQADR